MFYRLYKPQGLLSHFVDVLWFYDGYKQPHDKERLLPDGSMALVINLREDRIRMYDRKNIEDYQSFNGTVLVGAQSQFFVIDTAQQASVVGAHFKPGGAFPFFKLPAGELQDEHVSLDTVWGAAAAELRDRLLEAPTPDAKLRLLEQVLLKQAAKPLTRHPAVGFALDEFQRAPHTRTVSGVTEQIGLSSRRFIEVFSDEVGLTPKLFCRIRRFQQVIQRIGAGKSIDWADVALSCGYFDQAHFIHDFRAFSGINPSAYLMHKTEHLNHVPILD